MTITNYATGPDPFIVDLKWYESLPADLKVTFDQVAEEAITFSDRLNRESEQKYIALLEQELEVNYVSEDALQSFRQLTDPVIRDFIARGVFTEEDLTMARETARGE